MPLWPHLLSLAPILIAFILGLLVGSFLNVCIHRWPLERSVVRPRSHCPSCEQTIGWYDNIPVVSYFLLKRRCRHCAASISWRYPVVELLNAALWAALVAKFGPSPITYKCLLFVSMMIVLVFSDLEHYILPDEITLGGLVLGLAMSPFLLIPAGATRLGWLLAAVEPRPWQASLTESVAGAVVFGGMLWALRELYYRFRGIDGLGFGDVKMVAMIGAFWGVAHALMVLVVGSIFGAVTGTAIVVLGRKKWTHELPYGSYLGVAAIAVTYWADDLMGAYWNAVTAAANQ